MDQRLNNGIGPLRYASWF